MDGEKADATTSLALATCRAAPIVIGWLRPARVKKHFGACLPKGRVARDLAGCP
jgi:hypothetical protein